MEMINLIFGIFNSPVFWMIGPLFLLGFIWIPKTSDDEVLASHINELQTKKVDTDLMGYKARAYLSASQENIPDNTTTKVLFDAETYDPNGDFDADGVDSEYITPVAGYYLIKGQINWIAAGEKGFWDSYIYIDGVMKSSTKRVSTDINETVVSLPVSDILYVAAGKSIDLRGYQLTGSAVPDIQGDEALTFLAIHLLSI